MPLMHPYLSNGNLVFEVVTAKNIYRGRVVQKGSYLFVYTGKPGRPPRIPVSQVEQIVLASSNPRTTR